ncbi:MAG: hypothetical protein DRR16_23905 [Candidatus Parabeggiatoa sp. nov. 3]|nr:MAG: hypothetical protein DRR00_13940 [Gammaproteobacteria bacterium]RKZ66273.1 MAG: hypothetical protein DRQ99_10215 [Gammaproteobacteria bacterium]RKZ80425.1 MAG: hypothetical protein DRR16_23905 [Gammaproteobacteria bacterium]
MGWIDNMPKFILKNHFAIGLYTYLVQAELSTHRVLGHSWETLPQYYQASVRLHPKIVMSHYRSLVSNDTLKPKKLNGERIITNLNQNVITLLAKLWNWHVRKLISLPDEEFFFILQTLNDFTALLNAVFEPAVEQIVSVRKNLYLSSLILGRNMPLSAERKKAYWVEHLNQNECLTFINLSEIVGDNWLNGEIGWVLPYQTYPRVETKSFF